MASVAVSFSRLRVLHPLQTQRGGRVVQSEHIGRHVHENRPHCRMSFRHTGKQAAEERRNQPPEEAYHSGAFPDFHQAEPQGKHPGQTQGDFKRGGGGSEGGTHDFPPDRDVSAEYRAVERHQERGQKKSYPVKIESHGNEVVRKIGIFVANLGIFTCLSENIDYLCEVYSNKLSISTNIPHS